MKDHEKDFYNEWYFILWWILIGLMGFMYYQVRGFQDIATGFISGSYLSLVGLMIVGGLTKLSIKERGRSKK